ncbi:hypothetical protein AOC05_13635 [Arthrobacter alpinus]|uniref:Uncharacterized protein n=1 Tax=Arthrobacter alpinus TaxID=656366 RepID=A0A0M4QH63_9MICC|nr:MULTISPECIES: hypothetical protein [Arthrobacter]ALE93117.1 hypothetical protein AOC05_13635 [Arthrobacter alpinus]
MKNHHTARAEAAETAIAVQEAPAVTKLIFVSAGLGALLSALMLFLGAGDPATTSMAVFVASPLIPALCAAIIWVPLALSHKTEARRQTSSAAAVMFVLAIIFFFVEWSARFELSLYFAVMLFGWGVRLQQQQLKWAALPFVAAAIALRVLNFPGEAFVLLILGVAMVAWPFLRQPARPQPTR